MPVCRLRPRRRRSDAAAIKTLCGQPDHAWEPHRGRAPAVEAAFQDLWARQQFYATRGPSRERQPEWFTGEVASAVSTKQQALRDYKANPTSALARTEFRQARRVARRKVKAAWNAWWERWATDLENHFQTGNTRAAYSTLRTRYKKSSRPHAKDPDDVAACREYVTQLLNHPPPVPPMPPGVPKVSPLPARPPIIPITNDPPTKEELLEELAGLKRTAAGIDGMQAKMLQEHEDLRDLAFLLVGVSWRHGVAPEAWAHAILAALPKKPGAVDWTDHRFISLLSVSGKLAARVIYKRIGLAPIDDCQFGFRPRRDTTGAIFIAKLVAQLCRRKGLPAVFTFIDSEKAYDRVPRDLVWETLQQIGVSGPMLHLLQSMYDDEVSVSLDGKLSAPFHTSVGLRQGCLLSPFLFNLILDRALRSVIPLLRGIQLESALDVRFVAALLAYADDLALLSLNLDDAQHDLDLVASALREIGLTINVKKTEYIQAEDRRPQPVARPDPIPSALHRCGDALYFISTGRRQSCPICSDSLADPGALRVHFDTMHDLNVSILQKPPVETELLPPSLTPTSKQCPECLKNFGSHKSAREHWIARRCHDKHPNFHGTKVVASARGGSTLAPLRPPASPPRPPSITSLTVYGKPIKRVTAFKYLGRYLSQDDDDTKAIAARRAVAEATLIAIHKNFLRSRKTTTATRLRVYHTVSLTQLISGSATWVIPVDEQRKLRSFQQRHLRHCLHKHPKKVNGELRYPSRESILKAARQHDILEIIDHARLRWIGHIFREADNPVNTIFHSTIPGPNRPVAITTLKDVYLDLMEKVGVEVKDALDRDLWRDRIKRVLTPHVSLEAGSHST